MTNIQNAIKFAESEIRSLELAPKINGCEMTEDWKEQIEVWETAISALEKQIPKKPINKTKCDNSTAKRFENCNIVVCPLCNGRLKLKSKGKHCDKCGQALDWSDSE